MVEADVVKEQVLRYSENPMFFWMEDGIEKCYIIYIRSDSVLYGKSIMRSP